MSTNDADDTSRIDGHVGHGPHEHQTDDERDPSLTPSFADLDLRAGTARRTRRPRLRGADSDPSGRDPADARRSDLLGQAATGTGKTAAFALPVLDRLESTPRPQHGPDCSGARADPRARDAGQRGDLQVRPTSRRARWCRSTAASRSTGSSSSSTGASTSSSPLRVVPSTTSAAGRCHSTTSQIVVLDEADEMLDMGFADDLEAILESTPDRPPDRAVLGNAARRASTRSRKRYQRDPVRIQIGNGDVGPGRRSFASVPTWCSGPTRPLHSAASSTWSHRPHRSCSVAPGARSTS